MIFYPKLNLLFDAWFFPVKFDVETVRVCINLTLWVVYIFGSFSRFISNYA